MYYVEFLRVFRALRVFAIILVVLFGVAATVRYTEGQRWSNFFVDGMRYSSSATKTVVKLADGTEVTTIRDDEKHRLVVQRRLPGLLNALIFEAPRGSRADLAATAAAYEQSHPWSARSDGKFQGIMMDDNTLPNGVTVTHYINDRHITIDPFLVLAGFIAAIFASVIGGSLSKENDGHLELAWTKPVSRQVYAFTLFAIDAIGILTAGALMLLFIAATAAIYFGVPTFTVNTQTLGNLAMAALFPLAWYALGQACSASVKRCGLIIGMLWVAGFAAIALEGIDNAVLRAVLRTINTVNPIAFYATENGRPTTLNGGSVNLFPATQTFDVIGLSLILIVAIVASLVQWRRLEA